MSQIDRFQIEYLATTSLHPNPRNPKHHPEQQIATLVTAIRESKKLTPIAIDEQRMILAGNGRWLAAAKLGIPEAREQKHAEGLAEAAGKHRCCR
ncbi:MAG: ParB N-terminal domain-containing protein [Altererythrobacter sp.]|nr:ParB N-terminal domain-containing protein [Altererythrobacter sp.]